MPKRVGRKSLAQTPAPKKERIYGSTKNKSGSAASKKSAKYIELSEQTLTALKNKVVEYNKQNENKVNLSTLKAVYRRGAGAYSSSHRPTITGGVPNSRNAWAMARVNKFLKKKSGEVVKKAYVQDDDLLAKGGSITDGGIFYTRTHSDGRVDYFTKAEYERQHYGAGILFFCYKTNKILLIKRSENISEPNKWCIPGGGMEQGENTEETAKRETLEEVGYVVSNRLKSFYKFYHDAYEFETFLCCVKEEFVPILNSESSEYQWFKISEIPKNLQFGFQMLCIDLDLNKELELIVCENCGWNWKPNESTTEEISICHKCNHNNMNSLIDKIVSAEIPMQEIANKYDVSIEKVEDEFKKGIEHELNDKHPNQELPEEVRRNIARRIASHHLNEKPNYYTLLDQIESDNQNGQEQPTIVLENNTEDYPPIVLWAFDQKNNVGNGWKFYDINDANNHAKRLGINENDEINFEIRQNYTGKILLKKNDIKNIINGQKSLEEFYNVGGEIDVYEVGQFLENQRDEAESLLLADMTRIAKIMICQARIDLAGEKLIKAIEYEEVIAWGEAKKIWENCLNNIKNQKIYYENNVLFYARGGLAYGNSHDRGGIPLVVKSTGQNIEIEGGEGVINKRSMQMTKKLDFEGKKLTPCEIISHINEMGGGVKFKCEDVKEILEKDGEF